MFWFEKVFPGLCFPHEITPSMCIKIEIKDNCVFYDFTNPVVKIILGDGILNPELGRYTFPPSK